MTRLNFAPASLVSKIEESATLAIAAKARKMVEQGRNVIHFGAGEPDFNTPDLLIEAAYTAAKSGETKYTPVAGTNALRRAIAERISADYGISAFRPEEVLVSAGGKQAIFHFLQAALEPGDEVLILSPYWVSFPEMVKLAGGIPVIVKPEQSRVSANEIKRAISSKTRVFIFNSPSNPSGVMVPENEVREILDVLEPHPIWLLSDDTYYQLIYEPARWVSALKIRDGWRSRTCLIGSASKSFAMTGWRLGWAIAPEPMISAMAKFQSQVTSGASSISQAAVLKGLTSGQAFVESFRKTFKKRRDVMTECLRSISGLRWDPPDGAFYVFADFSEVVKDRSVTTFAEELLEKTGVCTIPGEAFGDPKCLRLTYATSEANIREGVRRIEYALKS